MGLLYDLVIDVQKGNLYLLQQYSTEPKIKSHIAQIYKEPSYSNVLYSIHFLDRYQSAVNL